MANKTRKTIERIIFLVSVRFFSSSSDLNCSYSSADILLLGLFFFLDLPIFRWASFILDLSTNKFRLFLNLDAPVSANPIINFCLYAFESKNKKLTDRNKARCERISISIPMHHNNLYWGSSFQTGCFPAFDIMLLLFAQARFEDCL